MSQITTGLYRLVGLPRFYSALQSALAGPDAHRKLVEQYIKPKSGNRILDLGSGSSEILEHLPEVTYVGIEENPRHVDAARKRFGRRGTFVVGDAATDAPEGEFDIVLMLGLLHHLSDRHARSSIALAAGKLAAGGKLLTLDPSHASGQHFVARFLIGLDSGRMVREQPAYEELVRTSFVEVDSEVRHDLLRVPYTHCITQGRRPKGVTPF